MELNERERRETILHTYNLNPNSTFSFIAKTLKMPRSTVSSVIHRFKKTLTIERAPTPGRPKGPANEKLSKKILTSVKTNPGLSDRDRGKKYATTRGNVRRVRARARLKSFKAVKQPNRSVKQNLEAKKRSRLLYKNILSKQNGCIIMDDETYVKLDFRQIPGNKFYVSTIRGIVPNKFKFILQDKFAKKLMIWQAICSCGQKSQAFVVRGNMNAENYTHECLQKRLLPMVRSHNYRCIFWPDLASCHYARSTLEWLENNNVEIVPKTMNPPNCPQFRPIEKYWAIVKNKLNKNGGAARDAKS
jgi:hypothetical protein